MDIAQFTELGVGCVLAVLIFLVYRIDRRDTEKRIHFNALQTEQRFREIIEADRDSRKANTEALIVLKDVINNLNGGYKHGGRDSR